MCIGPRLPGACSIRRANQKSDSFSEKELNRSLSFFFCLTFNHNSFPVKYPDLHAVLAMSMTFVTPL